MRLRVWQIAALLAAGAVVAVVPAGAAELSLERAVALALAQNPGLKAVEEQRSEVAGGVQEARADAFPQLALTSAWSRSRNPSLLNSPDFDEFLESFPGGEFTPREQELSSVGMEVTQPLFTFGKISAAVDLAEQVAEVAEAQIDTARLNTALAAAQAYYQVLAAREALATVEQQERSRRESLTVVQARFDIGEATRLELLQSQSMLAQLLPDLAAAQGELEQARAGASHRPRPAAGGAARARGRGSGPGCGATGAGAAGPARDRRPTPAGAGGLGDPAARAREPAAGHPRRRPAAARADRPLRPPGARGREPARDPVPGLDRRRRHALGVLRRRPAAGADRPAREPAAAARVAAGGPVEPDPARDRAGAHRLPDGARPPARGRDLGRRGARGGTGGRGELPRGGRPPGRLARLAAAGDRSRAGAGRRLLRHADRSGPAGARPGLPADRRLSAARGGGGWEMKVDEQRISKPAAAGAFRSLGRAPRAGVRRALPFASLLLLLLLLLLAACNGGEAAPAAAPAEERAVLVETAAPVVEDVLDMAELPGDLLPARRAVLAAEVPGTIESVTVDLGDAVRRGQTLVTIDTRALAQAVAEAESVFRQTTAQRERAENLFEKRSITKKDLLDAVTNQEVAESRLASARLELAKSRVSAPWAGRVTGKRVEVGDYATPGMPLIELVDVSTLKVRAPAPSADVPYLEVGADALVHVDALPGRELVGKVTRLGAELDPGARTLTVEVEIENPDGILKPGMLARVEIPRRTIEGALLVPLEAVVDLGDEQVVYAVEDGRAVRRAVELGAVLGRRVVVTSGIAAGDRIIVSGGQEVSDGQRVREAGEPEGERS